jgi:hypothetical protein
LFHEFAETRAELFPFSFPGIAVTPLLTPLIFDDQSSTRLSRQASVRDEPAPFFKVTSLQRQTAAWPTLPSEHIASALARLLPRGGPAGRNHRGELFPGQSGLGAKPSSGLQERRARCLQRRPC